MVTGFATHSLHRRKKLLGLYSFDLPLPIRFPVQYCLLCYTSLHFFHHLDLANLQNLLFSAGLWLSVPWVVGWFAGLGYLLTDDLLVMCIFLFLTSLTSFLGTQVFAPLGLEDKLLSLTALATGALLAGSLVVVPRLGVVGMAWMVVLGELVLAVGMLGIMAWLAYRKRS